MEFNDLLSELAGIAVSVNVSQTMYLLKRCPIRRHRGRGLRGIGTPPDFVRSSRSDNVGLFRRGLAMPRHCSGKSCRLRSSVTRGN